MIEPKYDLSLDIAEMADADPEIASELRDKRTNWDLRERIQKLDHNSILICKLWAFRDPNCESEKHQCDYCTRSVAVAKPLAMMNLKVVCLLCWLRAGRPFEEDLIQPTEPNA